MKVCQGRAPTHWDCRVLCCSQIKLALIALDFSIGKRSVLVNSCCRTARSSDLGSKGPPENENPSVEGLMITLVQSVERHHQTQLTHETRTAALDRSTHRMADHEVCH